MPAWASNALDSEVRPPLPDDRAADARAATLKLVPRPGT